MTNEHFEFMYEQYFDMVYRVAFSYMRTSAEAEDITAEVFAKLLKEKTTFESLEHNKAWLLRVTINKCKDALSHWWLKRKDIDNYRHLISNDVQENSVLEIVLKLPKKYKDVTYLYYYEGYKTAEIADILQKPDSTIRSHLSEARELLKGVLDNEGY